MRPEFWSDEIVAAMPDGARLFYIGLWNVADDAGWLEWRPSRIGALLYPYETAKRRETNIAAWSLRLVGKGRLVLHECGAHALIPTLPKHQRIAGKQSFVVRDAHAAEGDEEPVMPPLKAQILARDGYSCRYCGTDVTPRTMVLEHIEPRGSSDPDNLVVACRRCNWRKGSKALADSGLTLLSVPVAPKRYQSLSDSPVYVEERRVEERNGTHEFKERMTAAGAKPL